MTNSVIWIASGRTFINEAIQSAHSVKRHNSELPRILFTPAFSDILVNLGDLSIFTEIITLPERESDLWYIDCTHYLRIAFDSLFDKSLLLDTDTYVCDNLTDYFTILDRFDIVGTHAPGRVTAPSTLNVPNSFPELHIGALAFNQNHVIEKLIDTWLKFYQDNANLYLNNDQAPLRDALWYCQGVKVCAMPPEYCFRFPFGGFARGKIKILHGRSNRMTYKQIEEIANQDWREMRIFKRGQFR